MLFAAALGAGTACSPIADSGTASECGWVPAGFERHIADLGGVPIHFVTGGRGPAVVLLHGFPETWWTWRHVLPRLADRYTVIAPDLRGVGCSAGGTGGYDAATMARDIHRLVQSRGLPAAAIVGHDTGGWVAYAYARQYRDQVTHLVLSGSVIPGFGLEKLLDFRQPRRGLPHLPLFMQPDVPEMLIGGREHEYFTAFVDSTAMQDSGAVDFYARSYSRPGRLTSALGQYRALYLDAEDNRRNGGPKLAMPTLALSGVGQTAQSVDSLRQVASNVQEVQIPGGGHYVHEEKPVDVADALTLFFQ